MNTSSLPAFQFSAHQQINPSITPDLFGNGVTADDLTALSDIHIPNLLPPIKADTDGTNQPITEDHIMVISHLLGQLCNNIPTFPLPNFIPNTPLHNDVNIQAEINKIMSNRLPSNVTNNIVNATPNTGNATTNNTGNATTNNTANAATNTDNYNNNNQHPAYFCQPHNTWSGYPNK